MAEAESTTPAVSYEDLALIEDEFEEIDSEIIKQQYILSKPAFAKRAAALAKIPHFWPLVLEQAPLEIDGYIQESDSQIFAESLEHISVSRFELDDPSLPSPSPRSLRIAFHFRPNEHFTDAVLEKNLWYRRASDGWAGLVSEPVKIHWKADRDPTEGLTDAAVALWAARTKAGDMRATTSPEYAALAEKVEHWNGANTSFFTWFGWVSGRRWVGAEESKAANEAHAQRREARKKGEAVEEEEEPEEEDEEAWREESAVEVHEAGEGVAISLAEDIWPNAIKFFTEAQEMGELSDADFEDFDDEEMEGGDDEDVPVDIRALLEEKKAGDKKKRVSDIAPPAKKQKK